VCFLVGLLALAVGVAAAFGVAQGSDGGSPAPPKTINATNVGPVDTTEAPRWEPPKNVILVEPTGPAEPGDSPLGTPPQH
jgi:hypothetical protein